MRFAVALVSGLAAAVYAQTSTSVDPATASASACLKKCPAGDVNCQSHCITVPSPNEQQVNDTTKCAAACPQGDGSADQTQKFADCVQACIAKHYYVPSEGTPNATGGSGGNNGNSGSVGSAAPSSSESTATVSGTGAAPTISSGSGAGSSSGSGSTSSGASPDSGSAPTTGNSDSGASETSGSNSPPKTSSSAAATSTNAAPGMTFGATGALVGALAALFAL